MKETYMKNSIIKAAVVFLVIVGMQASVAFATTAKARHILVKSRYECENIKNNILNGADFAEMARMYSTCPSGRKGGDLGEFSPGQMVREFDEVVFTEDIGKVHGPVRTQFGFHLIEITERSE
ncbi:MAG: peptidylprolyl isomerase [Candidatus Ancaeobacter aquaticus]|nr:peptidylprolyl isomerase [Candidatus Ancaeobacter aquaticus]